MGAAALASLSLSWQESWIVRNGLDAELCLQSLSIPTDIAAHDLLISSTMPQPYTITGLFWANSSFTAAHEMP
ncbi:hypothetical protein NC652_033156 [Populus alba x Populus x berolinensis]|nr:hypothetical protein NC652_033156 [Populus alba x Populus x berolinensis]